MRFQSMRATAVPTAMSTASLRTRRSHLARPVGVVGRRHNVMMTADAATTEGATEFVSMMSCLFG